MATQAVRSRKAGIRAKLSDNCGEAVLSHLAGSSSLNRAEGVVDDVLPPVGSATGHISGRAGHVHVGSIGGLPC